MSEANKAAMVFKNGAFRAAERESETVAIIFRKILTWCGTARTSIRSPRLHNAVTTAFK